MFSQVASRRARLTAGGLGIALVASALLAGPFASAAKADQTIVVPSRPGTSGVGWEGTIPAGAEVLLVGDPLGVCDISDPTVGDRHTIEIKFGKNKPDKRLDVTAMFSIDWGTPNGGIEDEHLIVLDPHGAVVGDSDTGGQNYESAPVTLVEAGVYTVIACPFQNPTEKPYIGQLKIHVTKPNVRVAKGVHAPSYHQFTAPNALAKHAGEPSIGNNWKSDATMFEALTETYRVSFDDKRKTSTWLDVSGTTTSIETLDPILFTDGPYGRTFVSQLFLACSAAAFSDNDGVTWVPSQGCGEGTAFDHQTIGGGAYPEPLGPANSAPGYPRAVYYCAQGAVAALCGRSDDGGLTFGPGVPAMTTQCGVLHGHVKVGPDGTVYLPASNCHGKQGVSVSTDAGSTWTVRIIPDSLAGTSDPSVGVGSDGTVYFGYSDGSGKAKVAVSHDRGATWGPSADVGAPLGVHSTEFAVVTAGDGDRAAFGFLGTNTDGDFQGAHFGEDRKGNNYTGGSWHMLIATTYDGGKTWTTVDSTPKDPVQRGCMWNRGGGSKCRNLLDFNDITIDKMGRVLLGFADGCTTYTGCAKSRDVGDNQREDHGAIIRQLTGKTLFKAYDGKLPR
ncbi:MAG: sialidase family protein [Mycobacteriales bacterium]